MEHENVTVPVYKSRRGGVWLVCIFISLFSFPSCKNGSDSSVPAVPSYTKVSYTALDGYLQNTASASEINRIEVTDITNIELQGSGVMSSPLCLVLNNHPTKKVALKLPETVAGLTDMSFCFAGCPSLTTLSSVPAGVTKIYNCFSGCTKLTTAPAIPSSVTDMQSCFTGCSSLTAAPVISAGVTNMQYCFNGCSSLTAAPVIPNSVTDLSYCFSGCTNLTTVPAISSSVTTMLNCFQNCTNLTTVPTIPSSVTDIGSCFNGCAQLKTVEISTGVTRAAFCFDNGAALTSVKLMCSYGSFAKMFFGCSGLPANSIKVPSGYLSTYQTKATEMGTTADKFTAL